MNLLVFLLLLIKPCVCVSNGKVVDSSLIECIYSLILTRARTWGTFSSLLLFKSIVDERKARVKLAEFKIR